MSKLQRTKGAEGERDVCHVFSKLFRRKITRTLGQARDSGSDVDAGPLMVEVKRRQKVALLYSALQQAISVSRPDQFPAVAIRADGKPWLLVVRLEDLGFVARNVTAEIDTGEMLS